MRSNKNRTTAKFPTGGYFVATGGTTDEILKAGVKPMMCLCQIAAVGDSPVWRIQTGVRRRWLQYNAVLFSLGATMFQNPEVALDELPGTEDLDWEQLHPLYARAMRVTSAITFTIITVAISALNFVPNIPLAPVVILYSLLIIAIAIAMTWPGISIQRRGYVLRDKDILFRKGVIWRSVTAIPFNRIQHVETSSTPIDRKFGLATLQLFTAGGSGGDLKIDGLGTDDAESLRVFILNKAGAAIEHT